VSRGRLRLRKTPSVVSFKLTGPGFRIQLQIPRRGEGVGEVTLECLAVPEDGRGLLIEAKKGYYVFYRNLLGNPSLGNESTLGHRQSTNSAPYPFPPITISLKRP